MTTRNGTERNHRASCAIYKPVFLNDRKETCQMGRSNLKYTYPALFLFPVDQLVIRTHSPQIINIT